MGTNKNQTKTNEEPHQKTTKNQNKRTKPKRMKNLTRRQPKTKIKGVFRSQAPYRWANGSSCKPARDSNPESPDFQQLTLTKKIYMILLSDFWLFLFIRVPRGCTKNSVTSLLSTILIYLFLVNVDGQTIVRWTLWECWWPDITLHSTVLSTDRHRLGW